MLGGFGSTHGHDQKTMFDMRFFLFTPHNYSYGPLKLEDHHVCIGSHAFAMFAQKFFGWRPLPECALFKVPFYESACVYVQNQSTIFVY